MIINFDNIGGGSGSGGTGSVVSWQQDLSAGTQIAQITINGASQAVFAPEGGSSSGPTVINLDELTQAERVDLYNTLSISTSADTINENYVFYAESNGNGGKYYRLQYCGTFSYYDTNDTINFGVVAKAAGHQHRVDLFGVRILNDGSISKEWNSYALADLDRVGNNYSFCLEESGSTLVFPDGIPGSIINGVGTAVWYGRPGYTDGKDYAHHFNAVIASEGGSNAIAIAPVSLYAINGTDLNSNSFGGVFDYIDTSGNGWRVKFTWDGTSATVVSKTAI